MSTLSVSSSLSGGDVTPPPSPVAVFQLWENYSPPASDIDEPSYPSPRMVPASPPSSLRSTIPVHLHSLLEYLMGEDQLNQLDLSDQHAVTMYISQRDQHERASKCAEKERNIVTEVVRLLKLQATMRLSRVFTTEDLDHVNHHIRTVLSAFPDQSTQQRVFGAAKAEHRRQLLGQLIDSSLLNPVTDTDLFHNLIRTQAKME